MPTRDELIARAKPAHDQVCNCDPRYLMSCPQMATAILALARPTPAADDFDARWRAAALADPGHATYREAVPGHRRQRPTAPRTQSAQRPRKRQPDPDALRPAEPITSTHRDTGGMTVHWPKPVVIIERLIDSDAELPQLATTDAVQALADAIAKADQPRPWWRRWWR